MHLVVALSLNRLHLCVGGRVLRRVLVVVDRVPSELQLEILLEAYLANGVDRTATSCSLVRSRRPLSLEGNLGL